MSECYARTTAGGTELPEAPKQTGSVQGKRKRGEHAEEAPAPKQSKAGHIKIEDEDMREVAGTTLGVWKIKEEEEDFPWEGARRTPHPTL